MLFFIVSCEIQTSSLQPLIYNVKQVMYNTEYQSQIQHYNKAGLLQTMIMRLSNSRYKMASTEYKMDS